MKKKFLNFVKLESFFVSLISLLLLSLSLFPTIYEAFQGEEVSADRVLIWGEHNYTYDYNLYLAKMRQGQEGRWTVLNKVTTEPQSGVFLQMFYLLAGKLGGLFNLSPALTYLFLRVVLGVFWLVTGYFFISQFLTHSLERKIAFLFFAFSGSLPRLFKTSVGLQVGSFFDWWQEFDVLKRATYLPHFLFGHILMVVMLVLLIRGARLQRHSELACPPARQVSESGLTIKPNLVLLASLLGFLTGMVHPSSLIIVYGIWGLLSGYYLIRMLIQKYTLNNIAKYLGYSLFFFVFSFLSLFYIRLATSNPAWQGIAKFAQTRWLWSIRDFCLGLGASLFLGIGGLNLALAKKQEKFYPLIAWVLTVPLGMVVFQLVGGPDVSYFFQVAVHLPLAILIIVFLRQLCGKSITLLPLLTLLVLLFSLPGIVSSFQGQIRFINERVAATQPLVPYPSQVMYPLKDFWGAILWLEKNTEDSQVVFSEETAGNYIPAYAGNFVYLGHNAETVDFNKKKTIVSQFFSQIFSPKQAFEILKKNRVAYIFLGPQEKEKGDFEPSKYPFLESVFESNHVTLYRVINFKSLALKKIVR